MIKNVSGRRNTFTLHVLKVITACQIFWFGRDDLVQFFFITFVRKYFSLSFWSIESRLIVYSYSWVIMEIQHRGFFNLVVATYLETTNCVIESWQRNWIERNATFWREFRHDHFFLFSNRYLSDLRRPTFRVLNSLPNIHSLVNRKKEIHTKSY